MYLLGYRLHRELGLWLVLQSLWPPQSGEFASSGLYALGN